MTQPAYPTARPPDAFEQLLGTLSVIPVALIVVVTFADVFARYVFAAPIRGSVEIVEYAMALVIFTALPLVTRNRGHVSVSLIDGLVGGAAKRLKTVLCDLISSVVLGVLTWRLWVQAGDDWAHDTRSVVLGWPHAPLYYTMAVLAAASMLGMLWLSWYSVRGAASRELA